MSPINQSGSASGVKSASLCAANDGLEIMKFNDPPSHEHHSEHHMMEKDLIAIIYCKNVESVEEKLQ